LHILLDKQGRQRSRDQGQHGEPQQHHDHGEHPAHVGLGHGVTVADGGGGGESQPQPILQGVDFGLQGPEANASQQKNHHAQPERVPQTSAHEMAALGFCSVHPGILACAGSDNGRMNETSAPRQHPYTALTPDVVQDALSSVGLWGDGRLAALNSFENRVYQMHLESACEGHEQVVVKFYRPERWSDAQIQEEHAFAHALAAAEIPVVAPLQLHGTTLHHFAGFAFSVSPRRGGRRPELDDFEVLEWIGRFLARIHTVGAQQPFSERPALTAATFAQEPRDWLLLHDMVAAEVRTAWREALGEALSLIEAHPCLHGLEAGDPQGIQTLRLHGDCHPGNILWTPEGHPGAGPHFVDLDDARTGPAVQDLWMLLSGERGQQNRQLGALIDGYEQFRPFDRRELALIEPLRTLRLIHYSAWLARRWEDPAFPINFPWFGSRDYWQGQVDMLVEQIEEMQNPPLVA
jgi:Ser/Thr protein kinase RdoA (MazF antagonist)